MYKIVPDGCNLGMAHLLPFLGIFSLLLKDLNFFYSCLIHDTSKPVLI